MLMELAIHKPRKSVFFGLAVALSLLTAIACSSGEPDPTAPAADTAGPTPAATSVESTVIPTPAELPTPTDAPGAPATAEPTPVTVQEPTPTPTPAPGAPTTTPPTIAPAAPTPTSTPTPVPTSTPTPVPTSTPTPVPLTNIFNTFGFSVELDQDATFQSADLNITGWTGDDADNEQGLMTFTYNGANVVLFWEPESGNSPQATVDLTYQIQKGSQPNLIFVPISEGDMTIDGETGRFGGYLASDSSGAGTSGGLIGAWTCQTVGTQLSLTVSGPDAPALQIRFDRLTSGFSCAN